MPQLHIDIATANVHQTGPRITVDMPPSSLSDEDAFLQIANQLLANHRKNARDHNDSEEHPFCTAALIKLKDGRYFMAANVHAHNSNATRDCAEARAIRTAMEASGGEHVEIEDIYIMGSPTINRKEVMIPQGKEGSHLKPCGSCCDLIEKNKLHGTDEETRVHLLPLNDGTVQIIADDGRDTLAKNQIKTLTISELLPDLEVSMIDEQGTLKRSIAAGYEFLQDANTAHAINRACESGMLVQLTTEEQALIASKTPESNRADFLVKRLQETLMDTLKQETLEAEQAGTPLKKGTIAIVRTTDGSYYMGSYFEDGKTRSTPSAIENVLQNARRKQVTDVFVLPVDFEKHEETLKEWKQGDAKEASSTSLEQEAPEMNGENVLLKMPDGNMRDRIRKARPIDKDFAKQDITYFNGEPMKKDKPEEKEPSPQIHVFQPVPPDQFEYEKHTYSISSDNLLRGGFNGNKGCAERGG